MAPFFLLTRCFCGTAQRPILDIKGRFNLPAKIILILTGADIFVFLTSFVVGILGSLMFINIPPIVSYSLLGIGSINIALWIIIIILSKGEIIMTIKDLLPGLYPYLKLSNN